jgi:FkbM family methyltransferase
MQELAERKVEEWGYKRGQEKVPKSLTLLYRPETTDEVAIREVLTQNCYQNRKHGVLVERGERWLDLGSNVGAFALLALSCGASFVVCLEPETQNFELLEKNMLLNFIETRFLLLNAAVSTESGHADLHLCKSRHNTYRHSLVMKRGKEEIQAGVVTFTLKDLISTHDTRCVKMDVEGSEIEILEKEASTLGNIVDKLVFEYTFDHDRSIPRFLNIVDMLRESFPHVHHNRVNTKKGTFDFYPPCINVFCSHKSD